MIQGLNADVLAPWVDDPRPDQERVLLLNDRPGAEGISLDVVRGDGIAMAADVSGFQVRMTAPAVRNTAPWDVRDPERMRAGMRMLGIGRIVLRSLVGAAGAAAPVETLRCLASLGIPVSIDAVEEWMVRPIDGEESDKAFGSVDRTAWKDAWAAITGVRLMVSVPEGADGVRVYGPGWNGTEVRKGEIKEGIAAQ